MPIFFMALIALGTFIGMGLMLFYAIYCELKQAHPAPPALPKQRKKFSPELKTHTPLA